MQPLRVLAVGRTQDDAGKSGQEPLPGAHFVEFTDLTAEVIEMHQPHVVLSPLVSNGFDCVEVANRLVDSGFDGRYRAFAENLPRPELVKSEIGTSFPGLDFDVLVVTAQAKSA
ncbi:hypothetical protein [Maritimibacter sp. UBA3975]|uniref:hypothetical protein n=1 Tax=Maritimibacter sp. UBA3975 TaxID=1946833 RepID=UPI0025C1733C|nr:hypothetical protein [Maritimibacter sp. UBA3975]